MQIGKYVVDFTKQIVTEARAKLLPEGHDRFFPAPKKCKKPLTKFLLEELKAGRYRFDVHVPLKRTDNSMHYLLSTTFPAAFKLWEKYADKFTDVINNAQIELINYTGFYNAIAALIKESSEIGKEYRQGLLAQLPNLFWLLNASGRGQVNKKNFVFAVTALMRPDPEMKDSLEPRKAADVINLIRRNVDDERFHKHYAGTASASEAEVFFQCHPNYKYMLRLQEGRVEGSDGYGFNLILSLRRPVITIDGDLRQHIPLVFDIKPAKIWLSCAFRNPLTGDLIDNLNFLPGVVDQLLENSPISEEAAASCREQNMWACFCGKAYRQTIFECPDDDCRFLYPANLLCKPQVLWDHCSGNELPPAMTKCPTPSCSYSHDDLAIMAILAPLAPQGWACEKCENLHDANQQFCVCGCAGPTLLNIHREYREPADLEVSTLHSSVPTASPSLASRKAEHFTLIVKSLLTPPQEKKDEDTDESVIDAKGEFTERKEAAKPKIKQQTVSSFFIQHYPSKIDLRKLDPDLIPGLTHTPSPHPATIIYGGPSPGSSKVEAIVTNKVGW